MEDKDSNIVQSGTDKRDEALLNSVGRNALASAYKKAFKIGEVSSGAEHRWNVEGEQRP